MALGRQRERQADLMIGWAELPRSPGHAFYDRLQAVLVAAGFDGFAEGQCAPYYASKRGRPSLPPGRYFRMHLVGYFEGIDSERGLEWRCADSLSLREFLRLGTTEPVPDHSWLSKTRSRLPLEVHEAVFAWVLRAPGRARADRGRPDRRRRLDHGGQRGAAGDRAPRQRRGLPGDAGAAGRESGIATPTAEDLVRLDRKRKGKRLSNAEWSSPTDPEARIAKLEGRPHTPGLQARARGRPRHRARSWRPRSTPPTGATPRPCPTRSRRPRPTWRRSGRRRHRRTRPSWWRTRSYVGGLWRPDPVQDGRVQPGSGGSEDERWT